MSHEQFEEVLPLYAVGALERLERQALEAHLLTGCAPCHAALKQYHAVAGMLPYGLTPTVAPPTLKARVLAALVPGSSPDVPKVTQKPHAVSGMRATRLAWPSLAWTASPAFALILVLFWPEQGCTRSLCGHGSRPRSSNASASKPRYRRKRLVSPSSSGRSLNRSKCWPACEKNSAVESAT